MPKKFASCHPGRLIYSDGLCKMCVNPPPKRKQDFSKYRNRRYINEYGISLEQYNQMLVDCNFECQICGRPHKEVKWERLCVDHNHSTGKIRGLLCNDCNQILGRAKESTATLYRSIQYLKSS